VSFDTGWMVGQNACVVIVVPLKETVPVVVNVSVPASPTGSVKTIVKQPPETMYVTAMAGSGPASPQS